MVHRIAVGSLNCSFSNKRASFVERMNMCFCIKFFPMGKEPSVFCDLVVLHEEKVGNINFQD